MEHSIEKVISLIINWNAFNYDKEFNTNFSKKFNGKTFSIQLKNHMYDNMDYKVYIYKLPNNMDYYYITDEKLNNSEIYKILNDSDKEDIKLLILFANDLLDDVIDDYFESEPLFWGDELELGMFDCE